ncbi:MAG TPA: Wzz/FepE/Etk N-terminal domain-containing protein [Pirellulales bacterium]|nr:Wzz/FepE/Etk N-terminal domain-containing protein [Pirellulales bacterium]
MAHAKPTHISPEAILRVLTQYRRRWIVPAAALTLAAAVYAVARPDTWQASQALLVRNEAAGSLGEAARFHQGDELKATQETILEIAKSQGVLGQALAEVGPPAGRDAAAWPQPLDVAEFAELIKLTPPKGAEFGKTEVLYLKVDDHDRPRALSLATAVCDQLESRFQKLRDAKAQSVIDELSNSVSMTENDLNAANSRLAAMEQEVGGDLAELRNLHESTSGDSDLRRKTLELETELRKARLDQANYESLFHLLSASRVDQGRLLATPSRLFDSQPSLKRLKEGLVDAQLRSAQLAGSMSEEHPKFQAAREAEQEIGRHLHEELAIALRGVKADLSLASERADSLAEQLDSARQRLEKLAGARAGYSALVAEVKHHTSLVENARRELAEARGSKAGARNASLISRIDGPGAGVWPVGPSRSMIVAMGLVGGLATGIGILLLTVPSLPAPEPKEEPQPVRSASWLFTGGKRPFAAAWEMGPGR